MSHLFNEIRWKETCVVSTNQIPDLIQLIDWTLANTIIISIISLWYGQISAFIKHNIKQGMHINDFDKATVCLHYL